MSAFKVSKAAEDDLFEIGRYTEDIWGKKQRRKYLREIDKRFHLLAKNPDYPTAQNIDYIKKGYFSLQINEHFIIYGKVSYGVRIVRVLGQAMDIKRHL